MITEADGFKRVEGNDPYRIGIHVIYDNTVLLHEQVKELREILEKTIQVLENIVQKLEGEETHQHCN